MGLRRVLAGLPEKRSVIVCCLCLHATFQKPDIPGVDLKPKDGQEDPRGVAYCKLKGPSVAHNPRVVRSCATFIPAPNQVQRHQALDKLGGAFAFLPRRAAC